MCRCMQASAYGAWRGDFAAIACECGCPRLTGSKAVQSAERCDNDGSRDRGCISVICAAAGPVIGPCAPGDPCTTWCIVAHRAVPAVCGAAARPRVCAVRWVGPKKYPYRVGESTVLSVAIVYSLASPPVCRVPSRARPRPCAPSLVGPWSSWSLPPSLWREPRRPVRSADTTRDCLTARGPRSRSSQHVAARRD